VVAGIATLSGAVGRKPSKTGKQAGGNALEDGPLRLDKRLGGRNSYRGEAVSACERLDLALEGVAVDDAFGASLHSIEYSRVRARNCPTLTLSFGADRRLP
jgi:hypothetical protein